MSSVVRNRHIVQLSLLWILGFSVAALLGCTPPPAAKKTSPATTGSSKATSAKAPEVNVPAVETPKEVTAPTPSPTAQAPAEPKPEAPAAVAQTPADEKPAEPKAAETKPAAEEKPAVAVEEKKPAEEKAAESKSAKKGKAAKKKKPADEKPAVENKAAEEKKPAAEKKEEKKPVEEAAAGDAAAGPTYAPATTWLLKPAAKSAEAEATDEAGMKPYTEPIADTDVKFDLVPIKGGKFLMGSPDGEKGHNADEAPQHEVVIEPFWMGKCEVSWDEYELWGLKLDQQRRKMKNAASNDYDKLADAIATPTNPYTDMTFGMGKEGYPAVCMTQLAAKLYCKWLSAKTGHYYRLPTEAEWEYACRAGTTTAYSFGDDEGKLSDYAWDFDNSDNKYHKVGQKKPNPWGLYDIHGNVSEWVVDQYVPDFYKQFAGKTTTEPFAPATTEYMRVVRGGSWTDDPPALRSAARRPSDKDWKKQDPQIPQSIWYLTDGDFVGFRVVRPLHLPSAEEAKKFDLDKEQVEEFEDYKKAQAGKM
jgi:formylglycine-generating enzyme required for sulfatase activity